MAKTYVHPRWIVSSMSHEIWYFPGGEGEPGESFKRDECIVIPQTALHSLLPFLFEGGYLNSFLTKSSREEDLKVTHRLLDLIDRTLGVKRSSEDKNAN